MRARQVSGMSIIEETGRKGRKRKNAIELAFLLIIAISIIISLPQARAVPTIAENFYGTATINGNPAPIGSDIVAFSGGKICGRYVVKIEGKYGFLNCNTNSLSNLYFEVNGKKAVEDRITKENINLSIESKKYNIPKGSEIFMLAAFIAIIFYFILKERKRRARR